MLTVVKYPDGFTGEDGLSEFEQRHVRPTPGAVDGEKANTGGRQAIEMAVCMSHQFVGLFAGGVKAQRVVDVLVNGKRHGGVGAIDAGTTGVNQMLDAVVAAAFKDVGEADDVAVDVGERVLDGVAHTGLGGEVDDALGLVSGKGRFDSAAIGEVDAQMGIAGVLGVAGQPRFLDNRIVVVVVVVDADDCIAALKQPQNEGGADEASSARD